MNIVAFVTQKGGAGKSTLASSLAVAAYLAGERVFICDLDPVQSLVKWSKARNAHDIAVEHIPPGKLERALQALEKNGVTLVVIDTPGGDSDHSLPAIRAADLCIIPARPNVLDLWASEITLAKVKARRKDFAFLLNQCPPAQQSARVERGATSLQEMGALLAPMISSRVDYQEAVRLGLGVGELNPNGAAAREMSRLWASLRVRLKDQSKARALERLAAEKTQPGQVLSSYRDLFDQAIRVGDIYSDFLKALLPFSDPSIAAKSAAAAPAPEGGDTKERRGIP